MNRMAEKNIFLCDVELPQIVQEKADEAFSTIIEEGKETMTAKRDLNSKKKISEEKRGEGIYNSRKVIAVMAGLAAMAACAILMVKADILTREESRPDQEQQASLETETTQNGETNIFSTLDKMFTLRVKAAEGSAQGQQGQRDEGTQDIQTGGEYVALEVGRQIPLVTGNRSQNYVLGGDDETGQVDYCINIPLTCEGENIEKITYSIHKGAFQIVQAEGASIILDGEIYEDDERINHMNCGSIGGEYSEETGLPEVPVETKFYKSFTVDYEKQSDDHTWINVVDNVPDSREAFNLIWGQEADELEAFNSGLQKLLDNTVITCTVWYSDNTSQSVDIKVSSRIMTYREAGEPEAAKSENPDEKNVYITFELQE